MRRLPGDDLLDPLVDGARADETVRDHGVGLADAPRAVARLVLDRGVPPAVVQHDVVGRGEVQARAAGLERQHEHAGTLAGLEVVDHLVAHRARQPAVVALDRRAGDAP